LATARSRKESALKRPATTRFWRDPTTMLAETTKPEPLQRRIRTEVERELVTARSRSPSPSQSPTAIEFGPGTVLGGGRVNPPWPSPVRTWIRPRAALLAMTRSRFPSPLKSPPAIAFGVAFTIGTVPDGPWQMPSWQASPAVHSFPSSQEVPLG